VITKRIDPATPTLFLANAGGRHLQKVVIAVRKAGGSKPHLQYTLTDVLVAGYRLGGPNGSDPEPTESVTFNHQGLMIRYPSPPVIEKRK
jgi:type VI protein secretion system component Hcp